MMECAKEDTKRTPGIEEVIESIRVRLPRGITLRTFPSEKVHGCSEDTGNVLAVTVLYENKRVGSFHCDMTERAIYRTKVPEYEPLRGFVKETYSSVVKEIVDRLGYRLSD